MKRFLSVALSAALLCGGLAVTGVSAEDTAKVRPTVTLVESGFENGMDAPFSANESDAGKKATITPVSIADSVNAYLHLTDREANKSSAPVMQNVKEQLKANGAAGKYYISARIKLDNPDETAYFVPFIQGSGGMQLQTGGGTRFAVTDEWTTIGKKRDGSYMDFSLVNGAFDPAALTWAKFYFLAFTTESGAQTPYDGGYSIDDVTLWFVPNDGAPASVTEIGTNILKDGDFNAKVEDANYYNTQKAEGDAWYVATSNDAATGEPLVAATVEKETLSAVDTTIVHNGTGALHITNRPGVQQSIAVDLKDVVNSVGKLSKDEHYYISVWVRAETGTIKVQPIFGCSLSATMGNGYILPRSGGYVEVGEEWTEVGIDVPGEYLPFLINGSADAGNFDPFGATWASIRLATEDTANFYVDDFKVMGPRPVADAVAAFVKAVEDLPAADAITRGDEVAITAAESLYEGLNLDSLSAEQKATVAAAKTKLDAARAAFDALPPEKNAFVPEFKYENKANLIAPYGDLESFTANDYIWSEADVEGGHPKYTLITDKNIAHGGNNCLLISDRTSKYNAAAFTLTEVIKSQGGGKYYFSAWLRTKNPGDVMTVTPQLYISALGDPAGVYEAEPVEITNEWTFVGVAYDDLDGYLQYQGNEIPEYTQGYISLRFRGQNELWESDADGAAFPDYYIDDLKFWKAFDGQEDYEDPDNPKPAPTPSEPGDNSSTGGDNSSTSGDNGNPSNPTTGHSLPLALPVLGVLALGGVLLTRKRK